MVEESEIVCALSPLNGQFFSIENLYSYAKKVATHGKSIEYRIEENNKLVSFILFYDNNPEIFITMVWTHPEHQRQGYAKHLLSELIRENGKDILLEVHESNPAKRIYEDVGFSVQEKNGAINLMRFRKRLAVMQPYTFPHLGYFHLIDASDLFVFYDDVNYIIDGWISRNRILLEGKEFLFTIPVSNRSQNNFINETTLNINHRWLKKFRRTIEYAYKNAPYFSYIEPLVISVLSKAHPSISELAIDSIVQIFSYLDIPFNYTRSSTFSPETKGIERSDRLIAITKKAGYQGYVNSPGGASLYSKDYFMSRGIDLSFIKSGQNKYKQYSNEFIPGLSIIDILMFNDPSEIRRYLKEYKIT